MVVGAAAFLGNDVALGVDPCVIAGRGHPERPPVAGQELHPLRVADDVHGLRHVGVNAECIEGDRDAGAVG